MLKNNELLKSLKASFATKNSKNSQKNLIEPKGSVLSKVHHRNLTEHSAKYCDSKDRFIIKRVKSGNINTVNSPESLLKYSTKLLEIQAQFAKNRVKLSDENVVTNRLNPALPDVQVVSQSKKTNTGVFTLSPRGFGFINNESGSYFVSDKLAQKFITGQRIQFYVDKIKDKERTITVDIVKDPYQEVIAQVVDANAGIFKFIDINLEEHPHIVVENIDEVQLINGAYFKLQQIQNPWKDKTTDYKYKVTEFICNEDNKLFPVLAGLVKYNEIVVKDYPISEELLDAGERVDLTYIPFFTVDKKSTLDMDDAISIRRYNTEEFPQRWEIKVAIADPSAYIEYNSDLDKQSQVVGNSYYFPLHTQNMLPNYLSDDKCSLVLGQKRPALVITCVVDIANEQFNIVEYKIEIAWVKSAWRLDYNSLSAYYNKQENNIEQDPKLLQQLAALDSFYAASKQFRKEYGVVGGSIQDYYDFAVSKVDKPLSFSEAIDIIIEEHSISHSMLEEVMLLVNKFIAEFAHQHALDFIYSKNEGFSKNRIKFVKKYVKFMLKNHLEANTVETLINPLKFDQFTDFCTLIRLLNKYDRRYVINVYKYLTGSSYYFDKKFFAPDPETDLNVDEQELENEKINLSAHFPLGMLKYTTITSPIRRYSDLFNQMQLKRYLWGQEQIIPSPELLNNLNAARRNSRYCCRQITNIIYDNLFTEAKLGTEYTASIHNISSVDISVLLKANGCIVNMRLVDLSKENPDLAYIAEENALKVKDKLYGITDKVTAILIKHLSARKKVEFCLKFD